LVKGTIFTKGPPTSHNFLKIIIQKMLLKAFSTLTSIMAQSGCRLKRGRMPKGMASQPPGVETPN
jgi:hypothetical protein